MATTISSGESGLSVRNKLNDALSKIEGETPLTSVDITGGTINGTVIGGSTPAAISGTTGTFSGNFTVDTDTLFVDAANNRVGIGTSSPDRKLMLSVSPSSAGDDGIKIVEGANTTVLTRTGSTYTYRGVPANASMLYTNGPMAFLVDAATNISFHNNGNERMRIDASGNVGIGTTATTSGNKLNVEALSGQTPTVRLFNFGNTAPITSYGARVGLELISYQSASGSPYTKTSALIANSDGTVPSEMQFWTKTNGQSSPAERMRIDASGNVLIGGTTAGTASAGNLVLVNGTAPTGNVTNGITLYAEDVSSSSELKVRDEAGNVTTLSPHNFDLIPEGPSEEMAWSYYSERDGKRINVDMLKAIRLLEQISGEKLVHMV